MPPLSPDNTERWKLAFQVSNVGHHIIMRSVAGQSSAAASAIFHDIFTLLDADINTTTITGLQKAASGSNLFNDETWAGSSSYGSGTSFDNIARVLTLSFTGRTPGGRRARVTFWSTRNLGFGDYRVNAGESAVVTTVYNYLNALNDFFIGIDGLQPVWHNYANQGLNDHWVQKLRRTG